MLVMKIFTYLIFNKNMFASVLIYWEIKTLQCYELFLIR